MEVLVYVRGEGRIKLSQTGENVLSLNGSVVYWVMMSQKCKHTTSWHSSYISHVIILFIYLVILQKKYTQRYRVSLFVLDTYMHECHCIIGPITTFTCKENLSLSYYVQITVEKSCESSGETFCGEAESGRVTETWELGSSLLWILCLDYCCTTLK